MDGKDSDLQRALNALAQAQRREQGAHPSEEVLAAYVDGVLPETEAEALQEHLAVCTVCTSFVLEYQRFSLVHTAEAGDAPDPDLDVLKGPAVDARVREEQWQRLQHRLVEKIGAELMAPGEPAQGLSPRPPGSLRWFQILAATFLITTLIALGWGWRARRDHGPQVNVTMAELRADSDRTRGFEDPGGHVLSVAPGTREIFFSLVLRDRRQHEAYKVRLLGGDGRELWEGCGLRRSSNSDFRFALPGTLLPEGAYTLELRGGSDEKDELLGLYTFHTVASTRSSAGT